MNPAKSAPIIARPFISSFTHNSSVSRDNGCHLQDQLTRESPGQIDQLVFILAIILVVVATLAGLEWMLSVRRIFFTTETISEDNQEKHEIEKRSVLLHFGKTVNITLLALKRSWQVYYFVSFVFMLVAKWSSPTSFIRLAFVSLILRVTMPQL